MVDFTFEGGVAELLIGEAVVGDIRLQARGSGVCVCVVVCVCVNVCVCVCARVRACVWLCARS